MAARHSPAGLRSGDSGAGEFEFGGGTQVPGRNWGCPDWIRGDGDGGAGIWFERALLRGRRGFARQVQDVRGFVVWGCSLNSVRRHELGSLNLVRNPSFYLDFGLR